MRKDMAKVIVERPRYGSRLPSKGKGYDRRSARIVWEDQPKREAHRLRGGKGKSLNEHLAPLRRYLAGQIGRPWDKIFADICRYLDRNSAVQDHVRDHLDDYVAVHVMVQNGRLCHGDGYGTGRPLGSLFYVCPRSGILKKNPHPRRWWLPPIEQLQALFVRPAEALVRKDAAWHWITWLEIPPRVWDPERRYWTPATYPQPHDALLRRLLTRDEAQRIYGRPIYTVATRRASKREVRQYVNSYPHTNLMH